MIILHENWMKNKDSNFGISLVWPLSVEFISETVRDRGYLSTYHYKLSVQSVQRKKPHVNWLKKKNYIYSPNIGNFGIGDSFRLPLEMKYYNKNFGISITHYDDNFA